MLQERAGRAAGSGRATATSWRRRRPASRSPRPARMRRSPPWKRRIAASTRCCSTPRWRTPSAAATSCGTSPSASAAAPATGRSRRSSTSPRRASRQQVGDGRVVCGLSGRRGLDRRRDAHPPGHRRPARVHLRRQRPAAPERGARRWWSATRSCSLPVNFVDATDLFLDRLAGVSDPEQKRKIIGGDLHRRLRGRGATQAAATSTSWRKARSIPTSSSRCRCAARRRTIKSHHNVGGLPERMRFKLRRAAARAVQGRGAERRARPRHRQGFLVRQPFPGPGPRACASSAR